MPASNVLNSTSESRARADSSATRLLPLLFQLAKIQLSARPRVILTKWADNKQKHVRKKRDKNSHVYWYVQRKL
ncbi:hypothetical protein HRG_012196 [Hirsutella rhossiliensis]